MKDIHFGIGIFVCGGVDRATAEADFAESLTNAIPVMGIERDADAGPAQTHGPHATKQ